MEFVALLRKPRCSDPVWKPVNYAASRPWIDVIHRTMTFCSRSACPGATTQKNQRCFLDWWPGGGLSLGGGDYMCVSLSLSPSLSLDIYIYIYIYIYIWRCTKSIRASRHPVLPSCRASPSRFENGRACNINVKRREHGQDQGLEAWTRSLTDHRGVAMATSPKRRSAAFAASCLSHSASTP